MDPSQRRDTLSIRAAEKPEAAASGVASAEPSVPDGQRSRSRRTTGERVGGRSERVVREILNAAHAELAASGYAAFRIDEVASRAGVNRTTIYRRWPGKAELVAAALEARPKRSASPPDTGSVTSDLMSTLQFLWEEAESPAGQAIFRSFFAESDDPVVMQIGANARQQELQRLKTVLLLGRERGELRADFDEHLVAEMLMDAVVIQLRIKQRSMDETLGGFIQVLLRGLRP